MTYDLDMHYDFAEELIKQNEIEFVKEEVLLKRVTHTFFCPLILKLSPLNKDIDTIKELIEKQEKFDQNWFDIFYLLAQNKEIDFLKSIVSKVSLFSDACAYRNTLELVFSEGEVKFVLEQLSSEDLSSIFSDSNDKCQFFGRLLQTSEVQLNTDNYTLSDSCSINQQEENIGDKCGFYFELRSIRARFNIDESDHCLSDSCNINQQGGSMLLGEI